MNLNKLSLVLNLFFKNFCSFASRVDSADREKTIDLLVCIVDHYEPFRGTQDYRVAEKRVRYWEEQYPLMANLHKDFDGCKPQHTWFYPPHHDLAFLRALVGLCKRGYGEVEMHLHHNRMHPFPDTSESLRKKITNCIHEYAKLGIFCLPNGEKRYGFIHGDWSLDNSRGKEVCGVNDEITILKGTGCFADFTFPCDNEAQPKMINKIYYAIDNPLEPKSYDTGIELSICSEPRNELVIIPGVLGLRWSSNAKRFVLECSNLDETDIPTVERMQYLISNSISVKGSPNWRFLKLHTHGAIESSWGVNCGNYANDMFSFLERQFNDGRFYRLHYVTAREMFNIVKAAENGKRGDPSNFRDYVIPRYNYI